MLKFFHATIFLGVKFLVAGAIHENLSLGSYHRDEYGRALWVVASVFIVKSGTAVAEVLCERATAANDGTRCGGKKDASISMERSSDTFNTY